MTPLNFATGTAPLWLKVGRDGKPSRARYLKAQQGQAKEFLTKLAMEEDLLAFAVRQNTDQFGKGKNAWVDDFNFDIDVRDTGEYKLRILRAVDSLEEMVRENQDIFPQGAGPRLRSSLKTIRALSLTAFGQSLEEIQRTLAPEFDRIHRQLGLPSRTVTACLAARHSNDGPVGDCGW